MTNKKNFLLQWVFITLTLFSLNTQAGLVLPADYTPRISTSAVPLFNSDVFDGRLGRLVYPAPIPVARDFNVDTSAPAFCQPIEACLLDRRPDVFDTGSCNRVGGCDGAFIPIVFGNPVSVNEPSMLSLFLVVFFVLAFNIYFRANRL